jgi:hypothetical protein
MIAIRNWFSWQRRTSGSHSENLDIVAIFRFTGFFWACSQISVITKLDKELLTCEICVLPQRWRCRHHLSWQCRLPQCGSSALIQPRLHQEPDVNRGQFLDMWCIFNCILCGSETQTHRQMPGIISQASEALFLLTSCTSWVSASSHHTQRVGLLKGSKGVQGRQKGFEVRGFDQFAKGKEYRTQPVSGWARCYTKSDNANR